MLQSTKIYIAVLVSFLFVGPAALAETMSSTTPEDGSWAVSSAPLDVASSTPAETGAPAEPAIRVKLYQTKDPVKFSSPFAHAVYSGDELKGTLPADEMAALSYHKGTYTFKSKSIYFQSSDYVRLIPDDPADYFTLLNSKRRLPGRKTNYNAYRGALEYVFSPKSAEPYLINELPLEEYVAGLGEASNGAAEEYLKALAVAGRTYAYMMIGPRSAKHLFDVYASTVDQLYLGYNSEIALPRVAAASADTAGTMVTYNGSPVITNYFAHSNGLTKMWDGRGFGSRPWMQSVEAPYDVGKKMSGHGYGMSSYDAAMRALKDGWSYDTILAYYYTRTGIQKMY
ncbi:MAG: hypothetical protein HY983_02920 [Candidatus Magasanikbacteria bacterium]|nr:hypothetical protein [Candidatus Magasanikbacteria bacterium]